MQGGAARVWRFGVPLLLVLGGAALGLKLLDVVPQVLAEAPAHRTFSSVPELERAVGERLALPAYFPSSLRWPPTTLKLVGSAQKVVALGFAGRGDDRERLYFEQTLTDAAALPAGADDFGILLGTREVRLGARDATLARLRGPDGVMWQQLAWEQDGRRFRMRSSGSFEELARIAGSLRRERP